MTSQVILNHGRDAPATALYAIVPMDLKSLTSSQSRRSVFGYVCTVGFLVWYAWLYFGAKLFDRTLPDGETLSESRGSFVIETLLLPDQIWEIWSGFGSMPFGLVDRIPYFLCAAVWLIVAWLVGHVGIEYLGIRTRFHPAEQIGLSIAAGLNVISLSTLAIGLAGGSSLRWPTLACVILIACAAVALWFNSRSHSRLDFPIGELLNYWERRRVIFVAMACVLLCVFYFLGAILPPFEFDVREYHLQAPKEFYQTGRIHFLAHNIYANMPMGSEMHALAWMSLWGGDDGWYHGALIGKVIFASYAVITALILGGCVARQAGSLAGWIVACIWLGTPGIAEVSKLGLIDQSVACYLAASIAVLSAWQAIAATETSEQMKMVMLLGWYLGAAAASKYTAIPFVVLPAALVAMWFVAKSTRSFRRVVISICLLCCMGMFAGGLWYGKNWVLAENPVYPLAYDVFGGKTLTETKAQQWSRAHRVPVLPTADASNLTSDYRLSTLGHEFLRLTLESPYLGLLIIPLCVVGLLSNLNRMSVVISIWFLWYLFVWYFATHRLERFWLPALVIPTILAGFGSSWLLKQERGIAGTIFIFVGILSGLSFIAIWPFADNRYLVALSALRDDQSSEAKMVDLTATELQGAAHRVPLHQQWINAKLTASDKVLVVGDAQVFDYRIPILYSTCFDTSLLEEITKDKTPLETRQLLHEQGITHVLVHWAEIARYQSPGNYGFSSAISRELFRKLETNQIAIRASWPIPSEIAELYEVNKKLD